MNKLKYYTLEDIILQIIKNFTENVMDVYRKLLLNISMDKKDKNNGSNFMFFTDLVKEVKNNTDQMGVN